MLRLSHTSLDMFNTCGWKYKLKYIDHVKPYIPIRWALVTGVAFHNLVNKMYMECRFDYTFLRSMWNAEFMDALEKESSGFSSTEGWETHLGYGYGLIKKFYEFAKENNYLVKPIFTEWGFEIEYNGVKIVGKVDIAFEREDCVELLDFKSGWGNPTQEQVDNNLQLTTYSWAVRQHFNFTKPLKVGLFLPRFGVVKLSDRDEAQQLAMLGQFTRFKEAVDNEAYSPIYPNDKCNTCELNEHCTFFKNKSQVAS